MSHGSESDQALGRPELHDERRRGSGSPRPRWLVAAALGRIRSQPLPSAVVATVAAIVCGVAVATAGSSAAAEAEVTASIEDAGSRTMTVRITGDATVPAPRTAAIATLDAVDEIVALGPVLDVRSARLGGLAAPVPARQLYTTDSGNLAVTGPDSDQRAALAAAIEDPGSRDPVVALAGADAVSRLGLTQAAGTLTTGRSTLPLVGVFEATGPVAHLNSQVLLLGDPAVTDQVATLHVVARDARSIPELERAIPALLGMDSLADVRIDSPAVLARLQQAVSGDLGAARRRLLLAVLAAGLTLMAASIHAALMARRPQLGLTRALGASRSAVVSSAVLHYCACATIGAAAGVATTTAVLRAWLHIRVPVGFLVAVAVLTVLVTAVAATIPAVMAARRDPVTILRVP